MDQHQRQFVVAIRDFIKITLMEIVIHVILNAKVAKIIPFSVHCVKGIEFNLIACVHKEHSMIISR